MPFGKLFRKPAHQLRKVAKPVLVVLAMTVFALAQKESTIFTFKQANGSHPTASLVADSAGNLYGTTIEGGSSADGGTVFRLAPPTQGGGHWTQTVLYAFQGGTTDGKQPSQPVAFDAAGNLYGTTAFGGASNSGVIFELSPPSQPGGAWTETVLYSFSDQVSSSRLIFDSAGNAYGETQSEVYELSPPSSQDGTWTFTVLSQFTATPAFPVGGLAMDKSGNLYGTSGLGGTGHGSGCPGGDNCGFAF